MGQVVRLVINEQPHEMAVKEYRGERVVTLRDIDELHGRASGTARKRFNNNKDRFVLGADYFVRNSDEAREGFGVIAPNGLVLITESGYLMLVKSFSDDLAWTVQRELVNGYFRGKPAQSQTGPMDLDAVIALGQSVVAVAIQQKETLAQLAQTRADVQDLRSAVDAIEARHQEAEQHLLALPAPTKQAPELTLRAQLNRLVRDFCHAENCDHNFAYNCLYREFRDRSGTDIKARAKGKLKPLDVAERLQMMDDLYAVAYELFGPTGTQRTSEHAG